MPDGDSSATAASGECQDAGDPVDEVCDNRDNDCDNRVDEGISQPCGSGVALRARSRPVPVAASVPGVGEVVPAGEVCSDVDDDCGGLTDETLQRACGGCWGNSPTRCGCRRPGVYGACPGEVVPALETCNNRDEGCNGQVDDGVARPCGSDVGECVAGVQTCAAGQFGACVGEVRPVAETCNNRDQDCDGLVDRDISRACGSGLGECVAGVQTCAAGAFGACVGEVRPALDCATATEATIA